MPALIRAHIRNRDELRAALEALCGLDLAYLMRHPRTPPLMAAGVRYQREARRASGFGRREDWLTIPDVLRQGHGDCEDLACWRAAELRRRGVAAAPMPIRTRIGWHIVVARGDGTYEDPSRELGMGGGQ